MQLTFIPRDTTVSREAFLAPNRCPRTCCATILGHLLSLATIFLTMGCAASPESAPALPPAPESNGSTDTHAPDELRGDGGSAGADGGTIRADRFVTTVVSFTPGACAGFGAAEMPDVVLGPPVGAGDLRGSLDVVSLGVGGEIVLSFAPNAIVDGPGPDFIVFENTFFAGGDSTQPSADLGEVSVSEDGLAWKEYPCHPSAGPAYGACAGWHPVRSAPGNGVSPTDPESAGGEAYDLSVVGLTTARFVRVRDRATGACSGPPPRPNNAGFDLDAVAIVHPMLPDEASFPRGWSLQH